MPTVLLCDVGLQVSWLRVAHGVGAEAQEEGDRIPGMRPWHYVRLPGDRPPR